MSDLSNRIHKEHTSNFPSYIGTHQPVMVIEIKEVLPVTPCAIVLERVMGIEPTFKAWEALVLPLNYTRDGIRGYALY